MDFVKRYHNIGENFAVVSTPNTVGSPQLLLFNDVLAAKLGLNWDEPQRLAYLSGNQTISDIPAVALAYSGHQFGHFNPTLGDGRAHLIAALSDSKGALHDIQLKGSGSSTFSRNGDGLCALGPAVREFIMSKAMHALGVPTTECLSVIGTEQPVYRQSVLPGAVVCRVASSHIRVGSFQYLAMHKDKAGIKALMEHAIEQHFPHITSTDDLRVCDFLEAVCQAQITLVVEWLRVGFIHGVMNTDNTLISGETIDYGPCAMMDRFDFDTVFSSIDTQGRYAYGNQANIAHWNCARLAECLVLLIDKEDEQAVELLSAVLNKFSGQFQSAYQSMWANKLGILQWQTQDDALLSDLLSKMQKHKLDYTNTFAALTASLITNTKTLFTLPKVLEPWYETWRARIDDNTLSESLLRMEKANPALIPRNHLVEEVLSEFYDTGTSKMWENWQTFLENPYTYKEYPEKFTSSAENCAYQTFCGT